jgi:hypothetical protein
MREHPSKRAEREVRPDLAIRTAFNSAHVAVLNYLRAEGMTDARRTRYSIDIRIMNNLLDLAGDIRPKRRP